MIEYSSVMVDALDIKTYHNIEHKIQHLYYRKKRQAISPLAVLSRLAQLVAGDGRLTNRTDIEVLRFSQ
ncbi:MAG: hypothetical protein ABFS56_35205 [Pseudomonadota bacterium]